MIGRLYGMSFGGNPLTLQCGNVGYEIHVNETFPDAACDISLWIHEHAPQDAPHELYGFIERDQRDLFRRLLDIKGVGPKVAMRIVRNGGVTTAGIVVPATLRAIRGVGEKLANAVCEAMR